MNKTLKPTLFALILAAQPVLAQDRIPLKDVPEIQEGMIAIAMAYYIGETCPSIGARVIKGTMYLLTLRDRALELGYSRDEVEAYVKDKDEKARLEAMARGRFVERGAVEGDAQSFCAVGEAEIAAQSQIGQLLR